MSSHTYRVMVDRHDNAFHVIVDNTKYALHTYSVVSLVAFAGYCRLQILCGRLAPIIYDLRLVHGFFPERGNHQTKENVH